MAKARTVGIDADGADRLDAIRFLILGAQREGARMMSTILREVGLNAAQEEVLEVVRRRGPLTLAELGRLLVCEAGSPSRLVDGLVQRGLIDRSRSGDDKRVVLLTLTPDGEQAVERAVQTGGLRDHIGDRLTSHELDELTALLTKLVADTPSGVAITGRFPAVRAAIRPTATH